MKTTRRSTRPSQPRIDGFTLPEVLITVVLLGVIVTVLTGVASVVLRNTPPTEARADDARSVMGLVTWLPQDVDSTPPTGFDQTPTRASGCGTSPGTNILHLQWTETAGASTITYIANYRHVDEGGSYALKRITCSGTGSPPFAGTSLQNLTGDLPPLPVGWVPGDDPLDVDIQRDPVTNDVTLVTFEITTISGEVVRTDSAPKNPANTLPTTTLPSWYIPTPTTGVHTNTQPTTADQAITAYPGPATQVLDLIVNDIDGDPLVVQIDSVPTGWTVGLTSLTMSITPEPTDVGTTQDITYTVDDQQGDGAITGTIKVEVIPATTPTTIAPTTTTTTTTTTTLPSCAVAAVGLSRSSIKNVQADGSPGQVNIGVLFKAIEVNVTTNGYCSGLEIRYDTGGVNSPGFVNMTHIGPTSWTATLLGRNQGSSETWADGPHTIAIHSATGGPWASTTLTVT